jgi:diguanylate cyclase (GGDEF)-like protein
VQCEIAGKDAILAIYLRSTLAMSDKTEYTLSSKPGDDTDVSEKRPCLVMIRGDFIGQVYELKNDITLVGRSDDLDLVVSDTSISRRHAKIEMKDGNFYLSDLGSTNGCFINRDPASEPALLSDGDKVALGHVLFKFTFQDEDDTQYHNMLRNMAIRDGLTRIYNKRYFNEVLEKECEYNRRNKVGLCLIMFDIDHFKQINDTWGHPAGDYILKHLAMLIQHDARGYDIFARYGGEEFVILMRGSPLTAAVQLAERIREEVEDHVFEYDRVDLKVTISLGVTYWNGESELADDDFVGGADRCLYEAKKSGRNKVCYPRETPADSSAS